MRAVRPGVPHARQALASSRASSLADGQGVVHSYLTAAREMRCVWCTMKERALARVLPYLVRSDAPAPFARPSRQRIWARSGGDSQQLSRATSNDFYHSHQSLTWISAVGPEGWSGASASCERRVERPGSCCPP